MDHRCIGGFADLKRSYDNHASSPGKLTSISIAVKPHAVTSVITKLAIKAHVSGSNPVS
jgi:hypothetical protein